MDREKFTSRRGRAGHETKKPPNGRQHSFISVLLNRVNAIG